MKGIVTAEIYGIFFDKAIKATSPVLDFGDDNVFGRIMTAREYFYKTYHVKPEELKLTGFKEVK